MKYEFVKRLFKNKYNYSAYNTYYRASTPVTSEDKATETLKFDDLLSSFKKKLKSKEVWERLEAKAFFKKNYFSEYHVKALNTLTSLEQSGKDLHKIFTDDEVLEQCLILFACSNSLSWSLIKHASSIAKVFPVLPEGLSEYRLRVRQVFQEVVDPFSKDSAPAHEEEHTRALENFAKQIRLIKIEEFIRIALADYMDEDSLETTAGKVSIFADAVIEAVFQATGLSEEALGVIAMGKLGGNELNYSSDIDIMFISREGVKNRDTDILRKMREFISLLGDLKEDGNVFRVDMQIRPEGNAGELYLSPSAYKEYYERRSSSWERQAFIKARLVVGNDELKSAFKALQESVIFKTQLSSEKILIDIFHMKEKIEQNLNGRVPGGKESLNQTSSMFSTSEQYGLRKNFKLGSGGIRDIEFIVQFLQLHHGRLTPALNEPNTLKALKKLFNYKILSSDETVALTDNYRFLRNIEHRLQLLDLLAIRELPSELPKLDYLAGLCGYFQDKKIEIFIENYETATKETHELFDKVFKHTTLFLKKVEKLEAALNPTTEESIDPTWKQELQKFESDYFLHFSSARIEKHLKMLSELSDETPVEGQVVIKDNKINIEIATYSIIGTFSIIAGHISTKGINILNGFLFPQIDEKMGGRDSPDHFYRRSFAAWSEEAGKSSNQPQSYNMNPHRTSRSMGSLIRSNRKKIMVRIEGEFTQKKYLKTFNQQEFLSDLSEFFRLNLKGENEKVRETIYLRALPFLEASNKKRLNIKPVSLTVDNDSHLFYTMLHIKSQDLFLFLYQFTLSLSERRFRITKAEFATEDKTIDNIMYITERNREKVTTLERINEIKATLLLLNYFSSYIVFAPNPYLAFVQFSKLVHLIVDDYDTAFTELLRGGPIFKKVARILGTSQAIFEDFFRSEAVNVFDYLASEEALKTPHTQVYLEKLLKGILRERQYVLRLTPDTNGRLKNSETSPLKNKAKEGRGGREESGLSDNLTTEETSEEPLTALELINRFKDDVMFTIDLRFLAGEVKKFNIFCEEISTLTDVVILEVYRVLERELLEKFSLKKPPGESALLALGKWGGREMGYSSDIEIMFVYRVTKRSKKNTKDSQAEEQGHAFYQELGRQFPLAIKSKKHGIFELDFRLRPDGESAPIAVSFNKFKGYYTFENSNVRNFERMALTKLRALTGSHHSETLINDITTIRNNFVFSKTPFDHEELKRLRKLQLQEFTHENRVNVKFSLGGLVDIEYFIQKQIILHGHAHPKIRKATTQNTLSAMKALKQEKLLDLPIYEGLLSAYHFYRTLINSLRIVRGNAQDLEIPEVGSVELQYLIRRVSLFKALKPNENLLTRLRLELKNVKKFTKTL